MRVVLADDEPLARSRLRRLLSEMPDCKLVGEAADGESLLKLVEKEEPDVVLVDIHMPGMDGLHAARHLAEFRPPPAIIFTTAFSEHALSAFGTYASGYLLKPIKREQLQGALLKTRQRSRAQLNAQPEDTAGTSASIEVRERGRVLRIPLSAVIYCLAEDKYTRLVWEGGQHLIDSSLRQLEAEHPDSLLRVHRKVLVSPSSILGLEKHISGFRLILKGCSDHPPVSRRLAGQVREFLKQP